MTTEEFQDSNERVMIPGIRADIFYKDDPDGRLTDIGVRLLDLGDETEYFYTTDNGRTRYHVPKTSVFRIHVYASATP
jgi:hypothetical protein